MLVYLSISSVPPTSCWDIDFALIHRGMPWVTQWLSGLCRCPLRDSDFRIWVQQMTSSLSRTTQSKMSSATLFVLNENLGGVLWSRYRSVCPRNDITPKELICLVLRVMFNCIGQRRMTNDCFLLFFKSVSHFFSETAEQYSQFP